MQVPVAERSRVERSQMEAEADRSYEDRSYESSSRDSKSRSQSSYAFTVHVCATGSLLRALSDAPQLRTVRITHT
jgi:hypothetical protein